MKDEAMKKPIEHIKPNPHRNFDIYPIGESQVALLMESIHEVGMFLGLPARKVGEFYEIACGHHRLEALKRVGITVVDLAVNNYSDEEMLKIMIRENSTQRGNENFGAVLDSVGAVLVQCVRDTVGLKNFSDQEKGKTPANNLRNGSGVAVETIHGKEPSLSLGNIRSALATFRNTGTYLQLLKKGGLPEQFWHLYEDAPTTCVEAVAMFSKPAHAAEWIRQVNGDVFRQRFAVEQHQEFVANILKKSATSISVADIRTWIDKRVGQNITLDTTTKEEKTLEELAADLNSSIKSLYKKFIKFREAKGDKTCHMENIDSIMEQIISDFYWHMECRNTDVIDV